MLNGPSFAYSLTASVAFATALFFHLSYFFSSMQLVGILLFGQTYEEWPPAFRSPWCGLISYLDLASLLQDAITSQSGAHSLHAPSAAGTLPCRTQSMRQPVQPVLGRPPTFLSSAAPSDTLHAVTCDLLVNKQSVNSPTYLPL